MSKLPSMPFYPADFFADTRHLSCEEQGLYAVMLFHAWLSGGSLPDDEALLIRILRVHGNRWNRLKNAVLPFWYTQDSKLFNRRLSRDFDEIVAKIHTNTVNGKMGGRPPKLLNCNGAIKANGFETETQSKGNQNQNQNHIKKEFFNNELRQEALRATSSRWVPTKRIGGRLFKAGERAPAYDGQSPDRWTVLRPEDCQ